MPVKNYPFLGAFAKLGKVTISFVMSVRLSSPRREQPGSDWTDFHEILYLNIKKKWPKNSSFIKI